MPLVDVPSAIRAGFAAHFRAKPTLRVPPRLPLGEPKSVSGGGWWVSYRLDEGAAGLELTFFAHHRMTDDTLDRIDRHGRVELLDAAQWGYLADDPAAEEQYVEHHRRFYGEVARLGLGGGAPVAAALNAFLRMGGKPD